VALCRELNFTRAAKRCRVSQPSLSNGIKALELELGGQLFERTTRVLTPLGKRVRPHLENAIASVAQVNKTATRLRRGALSRHAVGAATVPKYSDSSTHRGPGSKSLERGPPLSGAEPAAL